MGLCADTHDELGRADKGTAYRLWEGPRYWRRALTVRP
jgi:hypothetical protein